MFDSNDKTYEILVKTFNGLESVLAEEIEILGGSQIKIGKRFVSFNGNLELVYRANLQLRTALRVLLPFTGFKAKHPNELYKKVYRIEWENYFSVSDTFAIDPVVHSNYFTHSKFAALKTKDAIVDRFRENFGKRPSVDTQNPTVRLGLHINGNDCTLSFDSSGESLHKRGYRLEKTEAPLNEVLAAGMIMLAGWKGGSTFIDAMCGSGTLPIEAAMIAANIAPGLLRHSFGFMKWNGFNRSLWEKVLNESKRKIINPAEIIIGSDISAKAIQIAKSNTKRAKVNSTIQFNVCDFKNYQNKSDKGTMILNPPYDERLRQNNINEFYKIIGDKLKSNFAGFDVWIISANKDAMKNIGLRTSKKYTLFNGPLECKFYKYEMYKGSKKQSH